MSIKSSVWFFLHHHRRNPVVARVALFCKNIHRATEHPGYDIDESGERAVFSRAVAGGSPVIFDVGANMGDWTAMVREVSPSAVIHSFELDPRTAEKLSRRFEGSAGINVHSFGLASISGEVDFFSYPEAESVLSGLRVALHSHVPHTVKKAMVQTGDDFCQENTIHQIDFLKIDAEGADFEVMQGFKSMFADRRISAVQFEHEGGRYLKDFYDFLRPKGYRLGKLYANYVDFREHAMDIEHFLGPNYIAILESQDSLIASLKRGW